MDGNGRWARERNLPRPFGHRAGMKAVREVVEGAIEAGVEVLTLFAFSDENWQRPPTEISALMSLLEEYIAKEADELRGQGVVVHVLGERARLAPGGPSAMDQGGGAPPRGSDVALQPWLSCPVRPRPASTARPLPGVGSH